ncbi:MAG: hypothetical protein QME89_00775, partial [Actinomycetota bacterium]|nr:hypothetical protein [Actinomycetota bacterium]
ARGFGSGKVTRRRRPFRGRDYLVVPLSLGTLAAAVLSSMGGGYRYFPTLDNPLAGLEIRTAAVLAGFFSALVIIGRCWKRWPWWRSRI